MSRARWPCSASGRPLRPSTCSTSIKRSTDTCSPSRPRPRRSSPVRVASGRSSAGLSADLVSSFGEFGRSFGMAFQLIDDVLDLIGDPDRLGKPIGADLRSGVLTMPALLELAQTHGRRPPCAPDPSAAPRSRTSVQTDRRIGPSRRSDRCCPPVRRWRCRVDCPRGGCDLSVEVPLLVCGLGARRVRCRVSRRSTGTDPGPLGSRCGSGPFSWSIRVLGPSPPPEQACRMGRASDRRIRIVQSGESHGQSTEEQDRLAGVPAGNVAHGAQHVA